MADTDAVDPPPQPPPLPLSPRRRSNAGRPRRKPAVLESGSSDDPVLRFLRALGPVLGGLILDTVSFATGGLSGFLIGGAAGYALARAYGVGSVRQLRWFAFLSAVYCAHPVPLVRSLPLATVVGVWLRFRDESTKGSVGEEANVTMRYDRETDVGDRTPRRTVTLGTLLWGGIPAVLLLALMAFPLFLWYGCRIEPGPDRIAVLIRKTGHDLPAGKILATDPSEKGIQLEVLAEGRHFRNPYVWGWEIHPIIDIPAGRLGVETRLYGDDLPPGEILATGNSKGILQEIRGPGKHRVNPYASRIDQHDALSIRAGYVGVKTALVGTDVLSGSLPEGQRNTFLVEPGLKGVVPEVLDPGTYYLNPYIVNVVEVNLQSQRFEMSGDDAITFLTLDGFTITVEGTIEFGIERAQAALVTHRVGDMEDMVKKVIMPRARGFSRTEGSKYPAIDFIVGETRQKFQKQLEEHLRTRCTDWGVAIKSVLIRKIVVPDQIASISRDREVAVQEARKFVQQTEQAKSKAELVRQETLAVQNKVKVETDTERIRATIEAQQGLEVQRIAAERELGVAKIANETAKFQAQSVLLQAEGDRSATQAVNEAEAAIAKAQVKAFGGGAEFAQYTFRVKVAPRVDAVLSDDSPGGFGGLFVPLLAPPVEAAGKGVAQ